MSNFWRSWLDIWCYLIILFGILLSGAGLEGYEGFVDTLYRFLNLNTAPVFNEVERFSIGLMGAVTVGWGLTLLYYLQAAHNNNEGNRVWRQLALAIIVWYAIDGYISYRTGFTLNIFGNTVLALGLLFPLYINGKLKR